MENEPKSIPVDVDQYISTVWESVKDLNLTDQENKKELLIILLKEIHNISKLQKFLFDIHQEEIQELLKALPVLAQNATINTNRFQEMDQRIKGQQQLIEEFMKK